jgi:hypothetical protein
MNKLPITNYKFSNIFLIITACLIVYISSLALIIALGKLELSKIQAIQPIVLVIIGILPSIATVIFSELIKLKSSAQLKDIERKQDMLAKRESLYKSLLENIEGFFVPEDEVKKAKFFSEYRIAWLYANDEVMRAINNFFNSINKEHSTPHQKSGEFYQMIISSMRNDIVTLKPLDSTTLESNEVNQTGSSRRNL